MDNRNFIIFFAISAAILLFWTQFITGPKMAAEQARQEALEQLEQQAPQIDTDDIPTVAAPRDASTRGATAEIGDIDGSLEFQLPRETVLADGTSARLKFETENLRGSIALKGARIDDLVLKNYREEADMDSPEVVLLSPLGTKGTYFADFGWAPESGSGTHVPTKDAVWTQTYPGTLSPSNPVEITWQNDQGLTFRRTIAVDDNFMFTITQKVENNSNMSVNLFPYGRISRHGEPETTGFYILHEGFLGVFNDELKEMKYGKVRDDGTFETTSTGGWVGFTDKYWLTALIPGSDETFNASYSDKVVLKSDRFRAQYVSDTPRSIGPGGQTEVTTHFFAGAKVNALLAEYSDALSISRFDYAIDWGLFGFFTRPLFKILDFFGTLVGNFGIAILITTILVKLAFFPLANKQYKSMAQMKKIQPEMVTLRERFADDKAKQQQELMALYKREQVNPMAGCLPILLQIPVFFALYKVLFITIEMRQAPFFGWIQDLAAPDPTTIFNLFGLLPYDPSGIPVIGTTLALGVWPLIMGLTMFLQMRMNPAPQDPIQEKMFLFMPIIFTVLLARFPAGLVIYWAWNNSLSILQQYVMMRRSGVEIELAKNLKLDKLMAIFGGKKEAPSDKKD